MQWATACFISGSPEGRAVTASGRSYPASLSAPTLSRSSQPVIWRSLTSPQSLSCHGMKSLVSVEYIFNNYCFSCGYCDKWPCRHVAGVACSREVGRAICLQENNCNGTDTRAVSAACLRSLFEPHASDLCILSLSHTVL